MARQIPAVIIRTSNIETPTIVMTPDGRMDRKNAATYVGLSVKTLAMKACDGSGPKFIKRGRVWYRIEDLDDWVNSNGAASSTAQARCLARDAANSSGIARTATQMQTQMAAYRADDSNGDSVIEHPHTKQPPERSTRTKQSRPAKAKARPGVTVELSGGLNDES
jgi:hypothetical protein